MKKIFSLIFASFLTHQLFAQVVINEVYLLKKGLHTSQEFFIELYNQNPFDVSIKGYKLLLYDTKGELINEQIISSTYDKVNIIYKNSFQHIKINRSTKSGQFLYCDFNLQDFSALELKDAQNNIVDRVGVLGTSNNKSICRYPDGSNNWMISSVTKNKRNVRGLIIHQTITIKEDLNEKSVVNEESIIPTLKDKIKINEVFYIFSNQDVLHKDYWIELMNVSDEIIDLDSLRMSTDTLYGKQLIFSINKTLKPGEYTRVFITHKYEGKSSSNVTLDLAQRSSVIYLFDQTNLIDSVDVPILDRDESLSRFPDGDGLFTPVKFETPGISNNQILPGKYARPARQFIHTIGVNASDYNLKNYKIDLTPSLGVNFGFAYQYAISLFDIRHSLNYKRQGFNANLDTTLTTAFGKIESVTSGKQRMEYLGFSTEIGLPVTEKWSIFYGVDFDIRLNNVTDFLTTTTSTLNSGEVVDQKFEASNDLLIYPDNIDLNLSMAIEHKISNNLALNLSFRRDFGGLNFNKNDSLGIRGRSINTNVVQLKLIIPMFQSEELKRKAYLLN